MTEEEVKLNYITPGQSKKPAGIRILSEWNTLLQQGKSSFVEIRLSD